MDGDYEGDAASRRHRYRGGVDDVHPIDAPQAGPPPAHPGLVEQGSRQRLHRRLPAGFGGHPGGGQLGLHFTAVVPGRDRHHPTIGEDGRKYCEQLRRVPADAAG